MFQDNYKSLKKDVISTIDELLKFNNLQKRSKINFQSYEIDKDAIVKEFEKALLEYCYQNQDKTPLDSLRSSTDAFLTQESIQLITQDDLDNAAQRKFKKQSYKTNDARRKPVSNQNSQLKHRKGNSYSSFGEFTCIKSVLKDHHKKKSKHDLLQNCNDTQVLVLSQVQNLTQRDQDAKINQTLDEIHQNKKQDLSIHKKIAKKNKDFQDQVKSIMVNKMKNMKLKQSQENLMIKGTISKLQTNYDKISPRNEDKKQKTLRTPIEQYKHSVITPKNQCMFGKREVYNMPLQSKSGYKQQQSKLQSYTNDQSLTRIASIRDTSVENYGDTTLQLRKSSRNNAVNNQVLSKQSSLTKLGQIIHNQALSTQQSQTQQQKSSYKQGTEATKQELEDIISNPLTQRRFIIKQSYSSSVQVSWTHQKNSSVEGLRYLLEYGVGIKVSGREQFRQIYKGKAFKCIVTDLMPKTTYRFRVAPIQISDEGEQQGEWSEVKSIQTSENQQIDQSSMVNVAVVSNVMQKSSSTNHMQLSSLNQSLASIQSQAQGIFGDKWIQFERPGLIYGLNPYLYGKHYWSVQMIYSQNLNFNSEEYSGLLKLGVFTKNTTSQKIYGPVVNYSTSKGIIKIKCALNYEHKTLKVYTQSNLKGDIYSDIPELGLGIYPAAQNMTMRNMHATLRVQFTFDLAPFEINEETGCIKDL